MSNEIERRPAQAPATLFGTNKAADIVKVATEQADVLKDVIEKNRLFAQIGSKKHVMVQGWTFLGSMLGVHPVTVWTRRLTPEEHDLDGWEARVEARTRAGEIVGAAEAMCTRDEGDEGKQRWLTADHYAMRSMAQTRATSKALRQPLDFVMQLAGFDATPAEEVPAGGFNDPQAKHRCPGCGEQTVVKVNSKNERAPKWKCENDNCTGGSGGRSWASWEDEPFAVSAEAVEAAGNDENVQAILRAMSAGEITKSKLISVARRVAKAEGEPQPTEPEHLANLSAPTRAKVRAELNLANEEPEEAEIVDPGTPPEPASRADGLPSCGHAAPDPTCGECVFAGRVKPAPEEAAAPA